MNIETTITKFIEENFLYKKDINSISRDESLLDSGLIDSMGIFRLVTFMETQFNIELLDEDIIPENLETISTIVAFVNTKRSEAG